MLDRQIKQDATVVPNYLAQPHTKLLLMCWLEVIPPTSCPLKMLPHWKVAVVITELYQLAVYFSLPVPHSPPFGQLTD